MTQELNELLYAVKRIEVFQGTSNQYLEWLLMIDEIKHELEKIKSQVIVANTP